MVKDRGASKEISGMEVMIFSRDSITSWICIDSICDGLEGPDLEIEKVKEHKEE